METEPRSSGLVAEPVYWCLMVTLMSVVILTDPMLSDPQDPYRIPCDPQRQTPLDFGLQDPCWSLIPRHHTRLPSGGGGWRGEAEQASSALWFHLSFSLSRPSPMAWAPLENPAGARQSWRRHWSGSVQRCASCGSAWRCSAVR